MRIGEVEQPDQNRSFYQLEALSHPIGVDLRGNFVCFSDFSLRSLAKFNMEQVRLRLRFRSSRGETFGCLGTFISKTTDDLLEQETRSRQSE